MYNFVLKKLNAFQTLESSQFSKRLHEEWLLNCSLDGNLFYYYFLNFSANHRNLAFLCFVVFAMRAKQSGDPRNS